MGKLQFHDLGRLMAIASGSYQLWAAIWGILYRKFFWDFVGGELGPAGIIPPQSSNFFVMVIVTIPIVQIFNIVGGILTLMIEAPFLIGNTSLHGSYMLRLVLYFFNAFLTVLVYQTLDASLFFLVSFAIYAVAMKRGEVIGGNKRSASSV